MTESSDCASILDDKVSRENYLTLHSIYFEFAPEILRKLFRLLWECQTNSTWENRRSFGSQLIKICPVILGKLSRRATINSGNSFKWNLPLLLQIIESLLSQAKPVHLLEFFSVTTIIGMNPSSLEVLKTTRKYLSNLGKVQIDSDTFKSILEKTNSVLATFETNSGDLMESSQTTQENVIDIIESPKKAEEFLLAGKLLLQENMIDSAFAEFSKGIELDDVPHELLGHLYYNSAFAKFKLGDYTFAKEEAKICVTLTPKWFGGYASLGKIYGKLEKSNKAVLNLTIAILLGDSSKSTTAAYDFYISRVQDFKSLEFCQPRIPLLSLTGKAEDILLSHVSTGEGGVQAVLNLRKVCSKTKLWVESLGTQHAKRIFSRTFCRVELSLESLQKFFSSPPPSGVKSLFLTNTAGFCDELLSEEFKELWGLFVTYWTSKAKLEYLDVGVVTFPSEGKLAQIMTCPTLRYLHCDSIRCGYLRPELLALCNFEKDHFYQSIYRHEAISHLELKIEDRKDLLFIIGLIERKAADLNFNLHLEINQEGFENDRPGRDNLNILYIRLAVVVTNSKSSIKIRGILQQQLLQIAYGLERRIARTFFRNVVGINSGFLGRADPNPNVFANPVLLVTDFPQLENFTLAFMSNDEFTERMQELDVTDFPQTVRNLQIERGIPKPAGLPRGLSHLDIQEHTCSVSELMEWLTSLANQDIPLRNLKINWYNCSSRNPDVDPYYCFRFPNSEFKDLKSVEMRANFDNESDAGLVRMMLLHGLKLANLKLIDLKLSVFVLGRPFSAVDLSTLDLLYTGSIWSTLLNLDIDREFCKSSAQELLMLLKSWVELKKQKRAETHGKELDKKYNR